MSTKYIRYPGVSGTIGPGSFPLLAPNGSAGAPSYSFSSDATTGMYFSATQINWSVAGTLRASLSTTAFTTAVNILSGTDVTYDIGANNNRFSTVNTVAVRSGASSLLLQTGSSPTTGLTIDTSQNSVFAGSVTGLGFIPSSSTVVSNGMYLSAANEISFSTNTTQALKLNSSQAATFLGTANFNKALLQSGTTSIALSLACTNNELITKLTGDAGGSSSTQITEIQSFFSTQKLATIQVLNTNATAASSGGIMKLIVNKGDGTLLTGVSIDNAVGAVSITGTGTNDSAASGIVGEIISANSAGVTPAASTSFANVASISLTAGDWDVEGTLQISEAATLAATYLICSISTSSAAQDSLNNGGVATKESFLVSSNSYVSTGRRRISLSATTTVYFVAALTYTVLSTTTYAANSIVRARRVR